MGYASIIIFRQKSTKLWALMGKIAVFDTKKKPFILKGLAIFGFTLRP